MAPQDSNNELGNVKAMDANTGNRIDKSNDSLVKKDKDDSLPHQDHGYAWFIVLGK